MRRYANGSHDGASGDRFFAVAIGQKSSGAGLGINPSTGDTENLAQIPNIVDSDTGKQLSVIVGLRHDF